MPKKFLKNGMKVWVRPTKCERAYLTATLKPFALSARAQEALSQGGDVRLEVQEEQQPQQQPEGEG
jgi:hypothetical protein